jgi:hydrogenase maturation protein HypF
MNAINKRVLIQGIVQGVGFRPTVFGYAQKYGVTGWILNSAHGVEIEVHGEPERLEAFLRELRQNPPRMAQIDTFQVTDAPTQSYNIFEILESRDDPADFLPVSPDLNICPDCLREMFDPADRRYRYPFINCTNCGPRFSIVKAIPYDRPNTSMADFALCPDCEREYHDPTDRRFHAQPVACPVCGPHIWLQVGNEVLSEKEDALQAAREMLKDGKILAVKGLGGFHLVCDANNAQAVDELRLRKRRSGKPFALMAFDLKTIEQYCRINPEEKALLKSAQAPIVLLELTEEGQDLARIVAPDQNTLGFMLPYTPLHYLLLEKEAGYPEVLLMTSANLSEEPIVTDNKEALEKLSRIADAFLLHNRPIETRIDDSVVSTYRGDVYFNRRARGYAPNPIRLPFQVPPSLAAGTHLKNTFTLARDHYAFISHHIGDLDNQETWDAYTQAIEHYQKIFRISPEIVACDLHPDYMATHYAAMAAKAHKIPLYAVQHHHAHISSCLADNGWNRSEAVIGLAFDGTGYGPDGAIWGGEVLLANYVGFERRCHFEYAPLPGGDVSIRKPARLALAYLQQFEMLDYGKSLALQPFLYLDDTEQEVIFNQVKTGFNTLQTSSLGRLFDAVASLIGLYQEVSYEAQNAIALEAIAGAEDHSSYDFIIEGDQILLAPLFAQILTDLQAKESAATISSRFHNAIVRLAVSVAMKLKDETGLNTVALSGGVWQNKLLLKKTISALEKAGFTPLWHHHVPTNDGGVSLGQLITALFQAGLIKE